MHKTCSPWVSSNSRSLPCNSRRTAAAWNNGNAPAVIWHPASSVPTAVPKSPSLSLRQEAGNVSAALRLPASSVLNAVLQSRRLRTAGPAPAVRSTRANSARTAGRKSRKERRYSAVTNAAGNRRIRRTRRSSAPNAEIYSTITIKNKIAA